MVFDASVLAKLFVAEDLSDEARQDERILRSVQGTRFEKTTRHC